MRFGRPSFECATQVVLVPGDTPHPETLSCGDEGIALATAVEVDAKS